jgi:glycine/sarcosine N-methyltransferase
VSDKEEPVDFYDALAPMFDVMTDWDARLAAEGPFLTAQLSAVSARRVLDAACGSGGHALALAGWGYDVAGADLSAGMIALAQAKAAAAGRPLPFVTASLADLPGHFATGSFDAALCLGNSLPHLLTMAELTTALRGMAAVLKPGGLLVTQALNYDLRWRTRPRWFAAQGGQLAGQEVLVWRFADYDEPPGQIAFHIALFRREAGSWRVQVHTTPQRPLTLADMGTALAAAGFEDVRAYGSMQRPAPVFDPETSGDLVLVAHKMA